MGSEAARQPTHVVGRYALFDEIASGGMATVHFGRLLGPVGFSRTVAVKRLHPHFAKDPDFSTMFLDEARLAARIQHPNVVQTLDVVNTDGELFLVMEYVQGESLSKLIRALRRQGDTAPLDIVIAALSGALHGLHAAHEAKSEAGVPLAIVHRDVSPQNILVGVDGVSRVLDFGVAKAAERAQTTRDGHVKGKIAYMAPEQLRGKGVDRRTDIFAAGAVLWEALTGQRLFHADSEGEVFHKLMEAVLPPPSSVRPDVPAALDAIVLRALDRNTEARYATARDFAVDLENAGKVALPRQVGEWVQAVSGEALGKRARVVAEIEAVSSVRAVEAVAGAVVGTSTVAPSSGSGVHPALASHPGDGSTGTGMPTGVTSPTAAGVPPPGPSRESLLLIVALATTLVAGVAGTLLAMRLMTGPAPTPTLQFRQVDVAPDAPTAEPTGSPSAALAGDPGAGDGDGAASSGPPSAAASAPSVPVPAPRPSKVVRPAVKPRPRPAPRPRVNCNPPYTVDEKGIKRPKAGCL